MHRRARGAAADRERHRRPHRHRRGDDLPAGRTVLYEAIRSDAMLGPVFATRIADWDPHLERMRAFWSSVALMSGRYHGQPMERRMQRCRWTPSISTAGWPCSCRPPSRSARRPQRRISSTARAASHKAWSWVSHLAPACCWPLASGIGPSRLPDLVGEIRFRRAYDPPEPDDGYRVLVDRVWPRAVTKAELAIDTWLKDLAPSTGLRRWFGHDPARWEEFERRYLQELEAADLGELPNRCQAGTVDAPLRRERRATQQCGRAAGVSDPTNWRAALTEPDDDDPGYASPPCLMHELDPDVSAASRPRRDPRQRRDVARWRKAESGAADRCAPGSLDVRDPPRRADQDRRRASMQHWAMSPAEVVSCYWPIRGEPDLRPWIARMVELGGVCALPVVVARGAPLVFHRWRPGERLRPGHWNIPVPAEPYPVAPDIVIAPRGRVRRRLLPPRLWRRVLRPDAGCAGRPRPARSGSATRRRGFATIYPQWHDVPMDLHRHGGRDLATARAPDRSRGGIRAHRAGSRPSATAGSASCGSRPRTARRAGARSRPTMPTSPAPVLHRQVAPYALGAESSRSTS